MDLTTPPRTVLCTPGFRGFPGNIRKTPMEPTPFQVNAAQRRIQQMSSIAPQQLEELVVCHLTRRLELEDNKLDILINGRGKVGKKTPLMRIASPFQRKTKQEHDMDSVVQADIEIDSQHVNSISKLILSLHNAEDLRKEGLFRVSGSISRQDELKERILQDCSLDLSPYTVHDRANVIKQLLADTPSPLLLNRHYEAFRQAVVFKDNGIETGGQRFLRVVQLLMLRLPPNNLTVCRRLIRLLHSVAQEEASNRMCSQSLGTLFAPHLLCPKDMNTFIYHSLLPVAQQTASFMVQQGLKIFQVPAELNRDVTYFLKSEKRLSEDSSSGLSTPVRSADTRPSPVNTSLTFVPRSQDLQTHDTTRAELAKLQAHIETLPLAEQRKWKKQFMEASSLAKAESGDTPRTSRYTPRKHFRSKSIGSSIKKRLPVFGGKFKRQSSSDTDALEDTTVTVMRISFEDHSTSEASVINCKTAPASKLARDSSIPASPAASPIRNSRRRRHHSDGDDATPPKLECAGASGSVPAARPLPAASVVAKVSITAVPSSSSAGTFSSSATSETSTAATTSSAQSNPSTSANSIPAAGKPSSSASPLTSTPSPFKPSVSFIPCTLRTSTPHPHRPAKDFSSKPLPFSEKEISILQPANRRIQVILNQVQPYTPPKPLHNSSSDQESPEYQHCRSRERCRPHLSLVRSPVSVETSL